MLKSKQTAMTISLSNPRKGKVLKVIKPVRSSSFHKYLWSVSAFNGQRGGQTMTWGHHDAEALNEMDRG
jgi:hypothetical protein